MKKQLLVTAALASLMPLAWAQNAPTAAQLAQATVQRYTMVLALSSTQQEQALTLFTTEETAELSIRTAEQTAEKSLITAVEADDTATIATVSATLGGLHGQELQARATAYAGFYAILTTDQQTKFAQYLEHGGLDQGPGGPGAGGPPPRH